MSASLRPSQHPFAADRAARRACQRMPASPLPRRTAGVGARGFVPLPALLHSRYEKLCHDKATDSDAQPIRFCAFESLFVFWLRCSSALPCFAPRHGELSVPWEPVARLLPLWTASPLCACIINAHTHTHTAHLHTSTQTHNPVHVNRPLHLRIRPGHHIIPL